jgi:exonuclease SbcC
MTYALFGKVPRTDKHGLRELISHGRDRMAVVLDFQVGGQPYRVARGRRRNGATQVQLEKLSGAGTVPVADRVETVDTEVSRLLGLGFDAFTQAVVLPQGQFAAFLKSEPRDRRKMLNGLLRLKVYERMRDAAGVHESACENRKAALERRLREDFEGVTSEAVAQLRGRQETLRFEEDESGRALAEVQHRLAAVRRDHEKTRELAHREQELAGLEESQPAIEAMARRLEAAPTRWQTPAGRRRSCPACATSRGSSPRCWASCRTATSWTSSARLGEPPCTSSVKGARSCKSGKRNYPRRSRRWPAS